jgi:hypothetical protein
MSLQFPILPKKITNVLKPLNKTRFIQIFITDESAAKRLTGVAGRE